MKKIKIFIVLTLLSLFEIVLIFYLITKYKEGINSGQIDSFIDLVINGHLYISFLPIICGLVGPFLKNRIGWTLTVSIFYLLTILGIVSGFEVGFNSFFEIATYILFIIFVVLPIVLMNSNDLKNFYKIDLKVSLKVENILSFMTMAVCSLLMIKLNG